MTEQITVLAGYRLNPGNISWEPFAALGEQMTYNRTANDQVLERAAGKADLLTNKTALTGDIFRQFDVMRYVHSLAAAYKTVDLEVARERGIVATNIPIYGTDSVAQHTTALMLDFTRGVGIHETERLSDQLDHWLLREAANGRADRKDARSDRPWPDRRRIRMDRLGDGHARGGARPLLAGRGEA